MDWSTILRDAACFDFLLPRAVVAADEVLYRCPFAGDLTGVGVCGELTGLCMNRLRPLYERPLLHAVLQRMSQGNNLPASAGDLDPIAFRAAVDAVRQDMLDDGGSALKSSAPLAPAYEDAIVRNFVDALSEMLVRLDRERERVSLQLLGGKPLGLMRGISDLGGETHCHGRSVLRIEFESGVFYDKPRPWGLDALLEELIDCWFPGCAVMPRFVRGDGCSFVSELALPSSLDEAQLSEYWYHLGALAALFHGLGSRDMTEDNVVCAGTRPAVVDAETLVAAAVVRRAGDCEGLQPSALNSSVLPWPDDEARRSPLTTDNANGTCLPRVDGATRTVAGFERDFMDGFVEGYRRLMKARRDIGELLDQARDVRSRKVLLNTTAYVRARADLFSASGLTDGSRQKRVMRWRWDRYDGPSADLRLELARADVAALSEGDLPDYSSQVGGLALHGADSGVEFDGALETSALELARNRLSMLSEAELRYELDVIEGALS